MILRRYHNGQAPHSAGQVLRHGSGQAATELAIFGAIIIFVLGAIIHSAVSSGQGPDASLKVARYALLQSSKSTKDNTSRMGSSILYMEDRINPDFSKYGSEERAPFVAQGSGTMTNMLMFPPSQSDLAGITHIPVMDMFINGKQFTFSTARLVRKTFSRPACAGSPRCGGWDFSCKGGAGCPVFYQIIVNSKDPQIPDTSGDEAKKEAMAKRFCTVDPCPGLLSLAERFDLNRDSNFTNDPPRELYSEMAWQWWGVQATAANADDGKPLHVDAEQRLYPAFDVDGDGQEEVIYQLEYNNGIVTGATVFDFQEGDLDLTGDAAATGKVGLLNDASIQTRTRPDGGFLSNYLSVQQGKAWGLDGTLVRSVNHKNQEDLVERRVQLSNDTGRMCNGENPVDLCSSDAGCKASRQTCFARDTKILYVRSRLLDKQGHFWRTDASGQLHLGR